MRRLGWNEELRDVIGKIEFLDTIDETSGTNSLKVRL